MEHLFTARELRLYRSLETAAKIQQFLDKQVLYSKESTCRSPRRVMRDRVGHCMEGALFAAAALRLLGHPPMLVDLVAVRDDDHVLAVYKERGHWGAIAKSAYASLRFREPVYRTIRELAMSYFEHYHNPAGEKTLRKFSRPVRLEQFDPIGWMTAEQDVWDIPNHLCTIPHFRLITPAMERRLNPLDRRLRTAERVGMSLALSSR